MKEITMIHAPRGQLAQARMLRLSLAASLDAAKGAALKLVPIIPIASLKRSRMIFLSFGKPVFELDMNIGTVKKLDSESKTEQQINEAVPALAD